jgi:hypothetical protein
MLPLFQYIPISLLPLKQIMKNPSGVCYHFTVRSAILTSTIRDNRLAANPTGTARTLNRHSSPDRLRPTRRILSVPFPHRKLNCHRVPYLDHFFQQLIQLQPTKG